MDIEELEAAITVATEEAFELADELSREVVNLRVSHRVVTLAIDYEEKRRYIRRLRRALKVEVAG